MARKVIFIAILFLSLKSFGQGEANSLKDVPFKERIVTGGGFGFGFSSQQSFISVSPAIGYQLTKRFMAGTSITYRYTQVKTTPPIKLNDYGVSPFLRFVIFNNVFLQTEFEYLNYEFPISVRESTREQFTSFLAGGGIVQPLSDKVSLYFMALYNFSYKTPAPGDYYPYTSPLIVRAGINVGNFGF
jgi:hypothetical protein